MAPYPSTPTELKQLMEQLEEPVDKRFIRPSVTPRGAPVFLVKKKNSSMGLFIDYLGFDKVTNENKYHSPKIDDLLNLLQEASLFSNIDHLSGCHQLRVREKAEQKRV